VLKIEMERCGAFVGGSQSTLAVTFTAVLIPFAFTLLMHGTSDSLCKRC